MDITINITDTNFNLKLAVENEIRSQVAKQVKEKLLKVGLDYNENQARIRKRNMECNG